MLRFATFTDVVIKTNVGSSTSTGQSKRLKILQEIYISNLVIYLVLLKLQTLNQNRTEH